MLLWTEMKCNILLSMKNVKLYVFEERPEKYLDIRRFKQLTNAGYCLTTTCIPHIGYLVCIKQEGSQEAVID